jgi:2-polyprenyl-3-methyl-5-hydroxy-6-metoxy-1,4-benzoquinol methylase
MHPTALEGFRRMLGVTDFDHPIRVLDVGGADVNGTVHDEIRAHVGPLDLERLDVLDVAPGPGVTIVADATDLNTWEALTGSAPYNLVISTETFEHVECWGRIVEGVASVLRSGGWFIGTCASLRRRPHGARGEHVPPVSEWYGNVDPSDLVDMLMAYFEGEVVAEYSRRPQFPTTNDLYWRAQVAR